MTTNKNKLQLPKSILDMKFMKKSKDRIEKELADKAGHEEMYSNIITSEMRQATSNFVSESSYLFCEDLVEGRMSYKGMNPEIERLMELESLEKSGGDMVKDVSDEILANSFKSLKQRKRPFDSKDFHPTVIKRKRK